MGGVVTFERWGLARWDPLGPGPRSLARRRRVGRGNRRARRACLLSGR